MTNLPWFGPGVVVALLAAVVAAIPLGRALGIRSVLAAATIFSLGLILAATMTPLPPALAGGVGTGICDFSRVGPAPFEALGEVNGTTLNILLFIPLGLAVGLMAGSVRTALVLFVSITLPFLIEALQLAIPLLARGCQSADVVDNLTGLSLGLLIGRAFHVRSSLRRT